MTKVKQIAFIPSRSGNARIYFRDGSFITAVQSTATRFATVAMLQTAVTNAYKAGTVSKAEIDGYYSEHVGA